MNWSGIFHDGLKLLAVLLLVLLNAFFVAAELALVRIRDTQLEPLAMRGNRRAKMARHIIAHLDAYIGATQFGITIASMGLGVAVEPVFRDLLNPIFDLLAVASEQVRAGVAIAVGFFVNCYLLIVVGELVPKAVAIRRTLSTALGVAAPLNWFYRLSYPFVWLLHHSSQKVMQWLGVSTGEYQSAQSEEELRVVLTATQKTADRRDLILNALDLRYRTAREVMRPRQEIVTFDVNASIADCLAIAEKTRYSRFPICDAGDLDYVLGIVHIKDLYALRHKAQTALDLLPVSRKLICIPETAQLDRLLQRFLEKKLHFAFVVDEFGGTLGVVTLENVIETIVGQIQDEFDSEATQFVRKSEDTWEVAGTLALHELEKIIGVVEHDEGVATASGWLTQKLGGFPKSGDKVSVTGFELRVEEMDGPRVARLKINRRSAPQKIAE